LQPINGVSDDSAQLVLKGYVVAITAVNSSRTAARGDEFTALRKRFRMCQQS